MAGVIRNMAAIGAAESSGGGGGGESVFIPYDVDEDGVYSFTPKDLDEAFSSNKTYCKAYAGDVAGTFTFAVQYMLDDGVYYLAFNTSGAVLDSSVQSEGYEDPFVDTDW